MRNRNAWSVTLIVLGMFSLTCIPSLCSADEGEGMIAHDVYFTLADNSPQSQKTFIAACQKYLAGHPGTIWFAAGPLAKELQGDLNDRDFGVALHLVFKNMAALEQYGTSERHQQFLKEMQSQWTKVRIFDSLVTASSHEGVKMEEEQSATREPTLPDPAFGFAGMIEGKVVHKVDNGLLLKVKEVTKVWEHNKAKDAQSLVGKTVMVNARQGEGDAARFVKIVHVGEDVTLDVAHRDGEVLMLLELTEDQRERVKAAATEK